MADAKAVEMEIFIYERTMAHKPRVKSYNQAYFVSAEAVASGVLRQCLQPRFSTAL